ncbi:hypothetical protein [Speluncibacter jeojiensis]|uniref:hypothetical protein n=1 Tax=Speluncibacter jeojiensis TaxID=2710754 RepID=UPI00240F5778|nr:hypothetical protein [Rhodococcus sp. D2-41]
MALRCRVLPVRIGGEELMRIRSIKPEFWRSQDISTIADWDTRLLFIGLWSYVDDNGVGQDRLSLITTDLFADDVERDARETFARVSRGLQQLSEARRIIRYTVDSRDLLYVTNWEKHQRIDRPNKPRYPLPTCENATVREVVAESSRECRESPSTGTEEQGNRGTEEKSSCSPAAPSSDPATYPAAFEEFWTAYPRKSGKRKALEAWRRARRRADDAELVAGASRYATDPNREDQFTKYAEGWLNRDGWLDEPLPARGATGRSRHDDKIAGWLAIANDTDQKAIS